MAAQQRRGKAGWSLSKAQGRQGCSSLSFSDSQDTQKVRQESGHGLVLLHTAQSGSSHVSEGCRVEVTVSPWPPHTTCPAGHTSSSFPKLGLALTLLLRPPAASPSQTRPAAPGADPNFSTSTESAQVHPAHPTVKVNQCLSKVLGSKTTHHKT